MVGVAFGGSAVGVAKLARVRYLPSSAGRALLSWWTHRPRKLRTRWVRQNFVEFVGESEGRPLHRVHRRKETEVSSLSAVVHFVLKDYVCDGKAVRRVV